MFADVACCMCGLSSLSGGVQGVKDFYLSLFLSLYIAFWQYNY